ncbi:hypothetical protein ANAEL_02682 [Anaerolineales bacterium]|nr:hypothetical protein ANAEL_02682 [Anaerolineales bacterium]
MKTFKRIILGILIVLAVLILFIPASIFVDSLLGADRLDKLVNTTVPSVNGGPDVRAYVARPQGEGPFPTVIMIHEFYGLRESIIDKADWYWCINRRISAIHLSGSRDYTTG